MIAILIHIVEQIDLLILTERNNLSNILQPSFLSDEPTVNLVYLTEQVVKTYLLFDGFLTQADQ